MPRMRTITVVAVIAVFTLLCGTLISSVSPAQAQAPSDDPYEQNDTPVEASTIPGVVELPNLTIYPAGDPDYYRALMRPGDYRAEVIATPGLDLTLQVYDPSNVVIATDNDPGGPNAAVTWSVPAEGYYVLEVTNTTPLEGFYLLRLRDVTPTATPTSAPTPTPPPTATANPTATSPFPTNTPTPELGGPPDYAEPNYDFAHAYRIVPGDVLAGLNFNSGAHGQADNDFFVMAVRQGITYTCETRDLGPGVDTNVILYRSAGFEDVIGGSDDVDTQSGQINSRLTFTSTKEGDIYVLVGYKYPETEDIPFPGKATYTLACFAASPTATPTPVPVYTGGGAPSGVPLAATPLWIEVFSQPEAHPTPTPAPAGMATVDVIVAYDKNGNGEVDPAEGVAGMSVRVSDPATNRELSHGFTGASGSLRFTIATDAPYRVVIPFLNVAGDFRPGSPAQWTVLIPPGNAPGLIP